MSLTPHRRLDQAHACVVTTARGVPWWGAVLIAAILTVGGTAYDIGANNELGWPSRTLSILGAVISVLAVQRRSIFTPMVQPPLVVATSLLICTLIFSSGGVLDLGIKLVGAFPAMVMATVAALILGMIRFIAQPLHGSRARPVSTHY
ncbi:hypothetical protein EH165_03725 [Nakamurella antarctica]|uniref:DUF6542 domain-containing protein n=1 Tax=Nakamurella antarctica TaxID=1902245 RepID=A0A3G8ZJM1_9ACTN|nr:DUF6542 domain-containing protein [Nakamurella antarctica]AZI57400.1 hypothetical protein EH165_03725 [Nakamurella antarctica]